MAPQIARPKERASRGTRWRDASNECNVEGKSTLRAIRRGVSEGGRSGRGLQTTGFAIGRGGEPPDSPRRRRARGFDLERSAARARRLDPGVALEAVHSGRVRQFRRQHQEVFRPDRRQGAGRCGKLGRHPPEIGGRRECRGRSGHHLWHARRPVQVPREAPGPDRPRRISRRQIWRLVSGCAQVRNARQALDRAAAGRFGRMLELPHKRDARRRLRRIPQGHGRVSQALPGPQEGG